MVHEYKRHHGFGDRRGSDAYAGIVPTVGLYCDRVAMLVDRSTRDTDTRSRLDPNRDHNILSSRNTTENSSGMIRHKTIRGQLVPMILFPFLSGNKPTRQPH